ncbi:SH3 domain-containing protein [Chelativorans sp. YIM 93263]|uniref:SH3 domain-containing protein n=1 Tax=Chelativorans sp. YIM 93263 TaxID=2906648 RepID=UPI00403D6304
MVRVGILAGTVFIVVPAIAQAESAHLTDTVVLRSGPGSDHARVAQLKKGANVRVFRCEDRWCSIAFGSERGWVSGTCLTTVNKPDAEANHPRRIPLLLGPGPVRSSTFDPPDWPGQACPQP